MPTSSFPSLVTHHLVFSLASHSNPVISLFLIIRFNPFRNIKFTDFDSKIAFDAGIFLLASILGTSMNIQYVTNYIKNV